MKLPVVIRNEEVKVKEDKNGMPVGPWVSLLVHVCVCWSMSVSVGPCLCLCLYQCLLVHVCVCQSVKTKPLKHLKLCFEMSLKCNGVIMKYKGAAGGGGS